MQPPGDYLLDPKMGPPNIKILIPLVSITVGLCAVAAYWFSKPAEEQANLKIRSSCGELGAVREMERLPAATERKQVEELDETILFLQDRCDENSGRAIERLEKVKERWEAALKRARPVSDLSWRPKNRIKQPANPQNMLPKRIMRG